MYQTNINFIAGSKTFDGIAASQKFCNHLSTIHVKIVIEYHY